MKKCDPRVYVWSSEINEEKSLKSGPSQTLSGGFPLQLELNINFSTQLPQSVETPGEKTLQWRASRLNYTLRRPSLKIIKQLFDFWVKA